MPNLNAWLGSTPPLATWLDDADRAFDTARVIADKPAVITANRSGTALDPQTVRLEPAGGAADAAFTMGTLSKAGVIILGYKSHPTIADTILRRGDTFFHEGQFYTVTQILPDVPDRLLAIAEARD